MSDKPKAEAERLTEWEFLKILGDILVSAGWDIRREPHIESWQPDLVVIAPSGERFVIECKFAASAVDFSTVDYLLSVSEALHRNVPDKSVRPVLVTTAQAKGTVAREARDSGLIILSPSSGPTKVADWLIHASQEEA